MESPGDARALDEDREAIKMYEWRCEELQEAGYDEEAASLVAAQSDIDLHEACDLMKRGCPVETALRILL